MGKFEGDKLKSGTFSLNFGCQMEPLFKPLHASDFQNYACRSSRKQNFEKNSKRVKKGVCGPIQNSRKRVQGTTTHKI